MSLTSEMSRITAGFEASQGGRLAGIAKIGAEMRRDGRKNKASLAHTMAAHRSATKSSLRDIFGMAAFTRGAAEEMIERFADEREDCTNDLREHLDAYVTELRKTGGVELSRLTMARVKMAHREEAARRVQLKELRRRVEALLANSDRLIEDFKKDRVHAGRVWDQHMRNAPKQRRAAATVKAAPHKPAAKKRKHARA
jgi:hypothetical protein